MTVRSVTLVASGLAILLSCGSVAPEVGDDERVLLFTKTVGFRHASIEPAVEALRGLAEARGVGADHTEDASVFNHDDLSRYDAVVFLLTTGDVLDDDEQAAFTDFVRRGGGFAGIHSASDTEYDWPWYGELVGGYFDGHPPGVHPATLFVADSNHPATATLPSPWTRTDEWYDIRDLQPGVTVLLDIDETTYKSPAQDPAPEPRPIAWYREFDGGRSFYTALGHTVESYSEPLFLQHVWGGIEWVLEGGGVGP